MSITTRRRESSLFGLLEEWSDRSDDDDDPRRHACNLERLSIVASSLGHVKNMRQTNVIECALNPLRMGHWVHSVEQPPPNT
jgi:hypothetical protein